MKALPFHLRSNTRVGHTIWALFLLLLASLLFSGCETTNTPMAGVAEKEPTVSKGMTEVEVIAILGEPKEIEEVEQDGVVAQIWRYQKEVVKTSTIESDGEQERVFVDQTTGKFVTVREPIYRNERVKGVVIAELLMVGGKVVALKEKEGPGQYEVGH